MTGSALWDTGVPDAVRRCPTGMVVANGAITYRRARPSGQLAELGVKPADVTYLAVSHTHGDHVGQRRALRVLDRADPGRGIRLGDGGPNKPRSRPRPTAQQAAGDHDVSVTAA